MKDFIVGMLDFIVGMCCTALVLCFGAGVMLAATLGMALISICFVAASPVLAVLAVVAIVWRKYESVHKVSLQEYRNPL
jgi:hypothetical protein